MSKKTKKVCATLNKGELMGMKNKKVCTSISVFFSFLDIPIGITSSAIVFKICKINLGIKKYKSII